MIVPPKPAVLVTGSAMLAWDLIHRTGEADTGSGFDPADRFMVYRQSGGAWHVTKILLRMNLRGWGWEVHGVDPTRTVDPTAKPTLANLPHRQLSHAYATWTDFARSTKDEKIKAVRVKGYLGTEVRREDPPKEWFPEFPEEKANEIVKLVIATEMANGASPKVDGKDVLTDILEFANKGESPWILSKYEGPDTDLARGLSAGERSRADLSDDEKRALYGHSIAVVPVDELRRGKRRIGHGLSWERLVSEVNKAIHADDELSRFRWVIVSFSCVGALIVSQPDSKARREIVLIYDPAEMEGTWKARYPGKMVGSSTCLIAAVAMALLPKITAKQNEPAPIELDLTVLQEAARDGLLRMRALHYLGYFASEKRPTQPTPVGITDDEDNPTTRYAAEPLTNLYKERPDLKRAIGPEGGFSRADLTEDDRTILELPSQDADLIARNAATKGPKSALGSVPYVAFEDLITTDPHEIEALQGIAALIQGYVHDPGNKPLSIAVFGQPGSGKSFGIKQIAKQLKGVLEDKTFNLSQLEHPGMLVGALHQVRDIGLRGKIPLVFWDEFDTSLAGEDLGWLRYFLAPMQDGEFQEDQVTHPIGRAIFVFAGGTCEQMKDFYPGKKGKLVREGRKRAKVPDFVSRLRGYLDVPGLNPQGANKKRADAVGAHLQVRRGIVLYSLLKKLPGIVTESDEIQIAPEVVRAFLQIPVYRHGARSMEAIVRMSALQHARSYTVSCLPSEDQLHLHVDGRAFLNLASA